jgi:hypothetical protein
MLVTVAVPWLLIAPPPTDVPWLLPFRVNSAATWSALTSSVAPAAL